MATTRLSQIGLPAAPQSFTPKTPADYPPLGLLVEEFDLYVQSYGGKTVSIFRAGTTELQQCYSDPFLTEAIDNPQVLLNRTDALGNNYGKFNTHVYVPFAYELDISSSETTGVKNVPITSLDGETADNAIVKAEGGTRYRSLKNRAADRIHYLDFGDVTTSATANNTALTAAIAAASANGGGKVYLPPDLIVFNSVSIPTSVILQGDGQQVTILQSQLAGKVITYTGEGAGLAGLQLDGVNLLTGSVGIYGKGQDFIIMDDVLVRRFDTNVTFQGGQNHIWRNFSTKNGNRNLRILGDTDASGTATGDEFSGLDWFQGEVSESTICGLELAIVDQPVRHNTISQVDFLDNVGTQGALRIRGASWQYFKQVYFEGNTVDIDIDDNSDLTLPYRQVSNIYFEGGQVEGGELKFNGLCQDIVFDAVELNDCDFTLSTPDNQIVLRDCVESSTLFTGETTRVTRLQSVEEGNIKGTTTNATATTVYKLKLNPNEVVQLIVNATAERTNGAGYADFMYVCGARCAGATLLYDSQTANFTAGSTIVGATSGASAIIVADSDSGTTGTLTLASVSGTFVDNEIIAEASGSGSASVNGSLTLGAAAIIDSATEVRAAGSNAGAPPAGYAITFVALGQEILVKVTGAASNDIFWNLKIQSVIL